MTESVPSPAVGAEELAHEPALGAVEWRRTTETVTFADLALAHFARRRELREGRRDGAAEAEYRRHLQQFEEEHGAVIESYWCRTEPAGVALTEVRTRRRFLGRDDAVVVAHFALHSRVRDVAPVAAVLSECETLAFQASQVLRGTSARIALRWLLAIAARLLDYLDRDDAEAIPPLHVLEDLLWRQQEELRRVQRFYRRAALQASSMLHLSGILLGAVPLLLVAAVGLLLAWGFVPDHRSATAHEFLAVYTMGVVGAVVSVILGMSTTRVALEEAGRGGVLWLGALRTLVGATFALLVYLAISGDLVEVGAITETATLQALAVIAFFAGFSERWVKGLIAQAVGADLDDGAARSPAAPTAAPPPGAETRVVREERTIST